MTAEALTALPGEWGSSEAKASSTWREWMEGTTVSDGGVCDGGRGERDGVRSNVSFHVSSFFF